MGTTGVCGIAHDETLFLARKQTRNYNTGSSELSIKTRGTLSIGNEVRVKRV